MEQIKNNLTVIYRACGKELDQKEFNQSRPDWFDKKKCFQSFYGNFGNNPNVKILCVFDGNKENELAKYIESFNIETQYLSNAGNKGSLIYCYELMKDINSEFVGLFEDDYLWLPNSYPILMDGLTRFKTSGTISLYQHPDRVFRTDDITLGKDYILAGNYCYWRTAESNTATFAISIELFNKHYQEFIDCNIHDRLLFTNLLKKYQLRHFTPVSERFGATHCNKFFSSLYINWETYNNSICL